LTSFLNISPGTFAEVSTWYEEAFDIFLSGLTPFLDHLSFVSNTPIVVDIMEARDEANHLTIVTFRNPYANIILSEGLLELCTPLFPITAFTENRYAATVTSIDSCASLK
jgi:hypothetical protein